MHLVDDTFFGTNFVFESNFVLFFKANLKTFVYCMNHHIQYALKPSSSIQKYFQDLLVMFHVELIIIYLNHTKENNAF